MHNPQICPLERPQPTDIVSPLCPQTWCMQITSQIEPFKAWEGEGGTTCLHLAARRGDQEIALTLLKAGADVDAPNDAGCTALHEAASRGACLVPPIFTDTWIDDVWLRVQCLVSCSAQSAVSFVSSVSSDMRSCW